MIKRIVSCMFILTLICISGCSKDKEVRILGNWVGDQASQKIGTYEELSQYNYMEITVNEFIMKNFVYSSQDNKMVKIFNQDEKEMKYKLLENDQIQINNKRYKVNLKKNEMTISNENIEIHYIKEG